MECTAGVTCDIYQCQNPLCDYHFYGEDDADDNEGDDGKEDTDDWDTVIHKAYGEDIPPEACRACGGPYPQCKTSCKLFDDD